MDAIEREIRERVAKELEGEADEYESQFGKHGPGAAAAGVLIEAARIAREGRH